MSEKIIDLNLNANLFFDHLINSKVFAISNGEELILYYWMRDITRFILIRPIISSHIYVIYNPYGRQATWK